MDIPNTLANAHAFIGYNTFVVTKNCAGVKNFLGFNVESRHQPFGTLDTIYWRMSWNNHTWQMSTLSVGPICQVKYQINDPPPFVKQVVDCFNPRPETLN